MKVKHVIQTGNTFNVRFGSNDDADNFGIHFDIVGQEASHQNPSKIVSLSLKIIGVQPRTELLEEVETAVVQYCAERLKIPRVSITWD